MAWKFNPFAVTLDYYEPSSGGGVSDGDKGDITVSGTGATWTIDNEAVTLAKQANVATGTVFYRKTAGAGAPEVQTLATLKTDLGLTGTNTGDQNDHGTLDGLADDDHTQYHNDSRATTWLGTKGITDLGTKAIDNLSDVVITSAAKNQHLIFNGTNWVNAADGTTFTFSCSAFDDGLTSPQLAGTAGADWKAAEAIAFTASYNNGPPTTADIQKSVNGGAYATINSMDGPAYTTGNNTAAVVYPTVDQYLQFRLSSSDGTDSDTDAAAALYFYNYIFYGASTVGSGFSEANVEALSSTISNSYTTSRSINAGASNYVVWAYPSRYTSIHATGAIFNSITMPFTAPETVSITNSAGLTENYKVFASTLTNLGNSTLQLSTSSTTINYIYWGELNKASGYTEADVEGNYASQPGRVASNSISSRTMTVNCTGSEYAYIAYPARLGALTSIVIGGFESLSDFTLDSSTLSITNSNGYAENYRVYVSNNPGFTDPTSMIVTI